MGAVYRAGQCGRHPSRPPNILSVAHDPAAGAPLTMEQLAALTESEREVLVKVAEIVHKIRFGTVVLVIQDGKVVQIEMAEKFRLR
jgi:hypothetical protein